MAGWKCPVVVVSEAAKKLEVPCVVLADIWTRPARDNFHRSCDDVPDRNRFYRVESQVFDSPVPRRHAHEVQGSSGNGSSRESNHSKYRGTSIECSVGLSRFVLQLAREPAIRRSRCCCRDGESTSQHCIAGREQRSFCVQGISRLRSCSRSKKANQRYALEVHWLLEGAWLGGNFNHAEY